MTVKGHLLRSVSAIALVTFISRICGYLRDQRVALLLGTSPAADAFLLAFSLPSLVRRTVGEGALGASFIPVFAGYIRARSPEEGWEFARRVFWDLVIFLLVIATLGVAFSRQLIRALTLLAGMQGHWELAVYLNPIIFPAVFFFGLGALAAAILNSYYKFALPASMPIFFNLVFIVFSLGVVYRPVMNLAPAEFQSPAVALGVGVLLGSLAQFVLQIPALLRQGMRFMFSVSVSDPGVRKVARLMGPAILGVGVIQINFVVDRIFATASRMPAGSVTSLYFADRVMQLVLGVYAIAMSTALLPTMSHLVAAGQIGKMKQTFGFSLRIVSFIAIPAAIGLILLRQPIIQVLFQHGAFVAESTRLTGRALFYYSLGLPAFAAIRIITPMYYSTQDTQTPARIGFYSLILNILLNSLFLVFLFRYLLNGSPALASSLAAYFNFFTLFLLFRRRYGSLGGRSLAAALSKMAICAGAMAAVCLAVLRFSNFPASPHLTYQAGWLCGIITVSVAIYLGAARVLRCEELSELFRLFRRAEGGLAVQSGVQL
ncbi:MAG TPA: murein biosynthesis integral membrane protein MurJ [Candidatus Limnocylindrales bacterium]|nr:murein biosynthesis integral membrane protein MurJ [Candidatus Limnocylindrales bacterium]